LSVILDYLVKQEKELNTPALSPTERAVVMAVYQMMHDLDELGRGLTYEALQSRQHAAVAEFENIFKLSMKVTIDLQRLQIPMFVLNKDPGRNRVE